MSNKTHGEIWISMLTLVDHPECSLRTDAHRISYEECVCLSQETLSEEKIKTPCL